MVRKYTKTNKPMKTKTLLLALIITATALKAQVFQKPDDKAYHVYAGTAISAGSGALIYKLTGRAGLAIIGGFGIGALAGGVKELLYDKAMGRGVSSWADAGATFWGGALGSLGLAVGINLHKTKKLEQENFQHLRDSLRAPQPIRLQADSILVMTVRKGAY